MVKVVPSLCEAQATRQVYPALWHRFLTGDIRFRAVAPGSNRCSSTLRCGTGLQPVSPHRN